MLFKYICALNYNIMNVSEYTQLQHNTFGGVYIHCIYCMRGLLTLCTCYACDVESSAITSLCLLILQKRSSPHSVSGYNKINSATSALTSDICIGFSFLFFLYQSDTSANSTLFCHIVGGGVAEWLRHWSGECGGSIPASGSIFLLPLVDVLECVGSVCSHSDGTKNRDHV